jgi:hypothetical protein
MQRQGPNMSLTATNSTNSACVSDQIARFPDDLEFAQRVLSIEAAITAGIQPALINTGSR